MVNPRSEEIRLRRLAVRQGLRLQKSRRRDPSMADYGKFDILDDGQMLTERVNLSQVEHFLRGGSEVRQAYARRVRTPENLAHIAEIRTRAERLGVTLPPSWIGAIHFLGISTEEGVRRYRAARSGNPIVDDDRPWTAAEDALVLADEADEDETR
jgi:hypothetical protein